MNPFSLNIASLSNMLTGGGILSIIGSIIHPSYSIRDKDDEVAVNFDSLVAFDHSGSSVITTAPVEQGKYSSINKVLQPARINVVANISTLSGLSGALPDIHYFKLTTQDQIIKQLDKMLASTEVYSIETPKGNYKSYDLVNWGYSVTAKNGVTLMTFNMTFEKVLQNMIVTLTANVTKESAAKKSATKATQGATKESSLDKLKSAAGNLSDAIGKGIDDLSNITFQSVLDTIGDYASDIASSIESNAADVISDITGLLS